MGIFDILEKCQIAQLEILPNNAGIYTAQWVADVMKKEGHEKVIVISRPEHGLKAVIAIHNRILGPHALGGCRLLPYAGEHQMITDVLRLSKAMTYKASMAGIKRGGAKCVVWADPRQKNFGMLRALAQEVNALGGQYIIAEDMNIDERDILIMRSCTEYVAGLPETYHYGVYRGSGDPSPVTAKGIVYGMKACLKFLGQGSLDGKTIAIQGLGKVGFRLARFLYQEGVGRIIACDTDSERIRHFKEEFQDKALSEFRGAAKIVEPDEIFSQECDIFAPCAGGAVINARTIPALKCSIVAGAANNQLTNAWCGRVLRKRGILYAPDYVINAGGLINVDDEHHPEGYNELRVQKKLEEIYTNLLRVFWYAKRLNLATHAVADMLAEERIYMQGLSARN